MSPSPQSSAAGPVKRPMLVVLVLAFCSLSASIMQSLVIPIQGELPRLLNTTASNASWVVTATLLGAAVAMPVAGKLADIHGKKRVLVISAGILLVGSVLCAWSDSLLLVLIGRVLQGFAMGYVPVGISMVREVTPPRMRNAAMALISATMGVGGSLGMPLAAFIAQRFDWRMLFWVAAALAVAMILLSLIVLPNIRPRRRGTVDVVGAIVLAIGLVSLLVGVTKGNDWGWATAPTWALIIGGVLVLGLWGFYQLSRDHPLVDLRTTARLPVLFTNLASIAMGFGMMAQAIVVPQLLQMPRASGFGFGQSILQTGLWMAPGGVVMLLLSPVSSRILTRLGGRRTLAIGASILGSGYLFAVLMPGGPWILMLATCITSAGVGVGYAAMPTLIMDNVPDEESSASVGLNSLMRSVGATVAGAVMVIILTASTMTLGEATIPTATAFTACFLVGAAAAGVAVVLTLLIPRGRMQYQ